MRVRSGHTGKGTNSGFLVLASGKNNPSESGFTVKLEPGEIGQAAGVDLVPKTNQCPLLLYKRGGTKLLASLKQILTCRGQTKQVSELFG